MEKVNQLSSAQVLIMAVTAGICVANIYYNQPILQEIAISLHIDPKNIGTISPLAQAGYGLGLLFITPLGDKMDRKRLILYLQILLILALIGMSFASTLFQLYAASLAIGLFAVTAQVILPMAASLVTENKGKIVGIIFTGILIGVLTARVFSGFITEGLGWQYVYRISAILVALSALLMQTDFPSNKDRFNGSYLQLLQSVMLQLKRFHTLRVTALIGALAFGSLSSFWVTLTFYLSGSPFKYSTSVIGLFGLLAAGGALLAPFIGKLADKGNPRRSLTISLAFILVSIGALYVFHGSLISLLVAVLLIDIGVQAVQITNIALIYSLDTQANSRINTVYMTSYFIGGAGGAYIGLLAWNYGGWNMVLGQMAVFIVIALIASRSIRKS
jgi:predicted MFS family arabinose efflux permease